MTHHTLAKWHDAVAALPLVAILRGLHPDEAVAVGESLLDAGFRVLEVPLNSPEPFESIGRMVKAFGSRAVVGAGTVLSVPQVEALKAVGGEICISPNTHPSVIRRAKELALVSFPAFFTPTEAFQAIEAGADALKLFPAELAGVAGLKAMKAVLPKEMPVFPVGGVDPAGMKAYLAAGAAGFGIGSAVYKPGDTPEVVYAKAKAFTDAWAELS